MWRLIAKPERRNFFVEDGIAYTEDRVPIRRVSFSCAASVPQTYLRLHFVTLGEITEMTYERPEIRGTMLFERATSAARALYRQEHRVLGRRVYLMACGSAQQPQYDGGKMSGYKLPLLDDVLRMLVTDYLPLEARLTFAATCRRFEEIYKLESKRRGRVLDLAEVGQLTEWGINQLMRLSGSHIRELRGGPLPLNWPHLKRLAEGLGPNCPALKIVHLNEVPLSSPHMHLLFERAEGLRNVTELSLRRCGLTDQDLPAIHPMVLLLKLDLLGNTGLNGSHLHRLPPSLQVLVLTRCENLDPGNLYKLGCLPALRELRCSMIRYRNLQQDWFEFEDVITVDMDAVYDSVARNCPGLEILEITECPYLDEEEIGGLPRLQRLVLKALPLEPEPYSVKVDLMRKLAERNVLQHLQLGKAGPNYVPLDSLEAISRMTRLRTLVMPNQERSGQDLMMLRALTDLRRLDLSGSALLGNYNVADLVQELRRLKVLKLQRCPLISRHLLPLLMAEMRTRRLN
ncbi:hypothetical protein KR067_006878, partial [Drosophila pandora]